jgi:hypothetical protein
LQRRRKLLPQFFNLCRLDDEGGRFSASCSTRAWTRAARSSWLFQVAVSHQLQRPEHKPRPPLDVVLAREIKRGFIGSWLKKEVCANHSVLSCRAIGSLTARSVLAPRP